MIILIASFLAHQLSSVISYRPTSWFLVREGGKEVLLRASESGSRCLSLTSYNKLEGAVRSLTSDSNGNIFVLRDLGAGSEIQKYKDYPDWKILSHEIYSSKILKLVSNEKSGVIFGLDAFASPIYQNNLALLSRYGRSKLGFPISTQLQAFLSSDGRMLLSWSTQASAGSELGSTIVCTNLGRSYRTPSIKESVGQQVTGFFPSMIRDAFWVGTSNGNFYKTRISAGRKSLTPLVFSFKNSAIGQNNFYYSAHSEEILTISNDHNLYIGKEYDDGKFSFHPSSWQSSVTHPLELCFDQQGKFFGIANADRWVVAELKNGTIKTSFQGDFGSLSYQNFLAVTH